jgi:hypothetical protein
MNKQLFRGLIVAALAMAAPLFPASVPSAFAGELKLTMQGGRVTIIADRVPLRQILQEWSRVGQTTIVNADKMTGPAITLQLVDAPEREALDILLRSASGYIAAPRPVPLANAAFYDRVTIMATSRAPAATATQAAAPPPFQRPPTPIDDNDEPINVVPNQANPSQVNPAFGVFPGNGGINGPAMMAQPGQVPATMAQPGQMPPAMAQPGQPSTAAPQGSPLTLPRPGAVPPQVQQPGTQINPYQPIVRPPVKPGGGGGPEGH